MKVKIVKCSNPEYWYADKIGKVFEVINNDNENYEAISAYGTEGYILKKDTEIIETYLYHNGRKIPVSEDIVKQIVEPTYSEIRNALYNEHSGFSQTRVSTDLKPGEILMENQPLKDYVENIECLIKLMDVAHYLNTFAHREDKMWYLVDFDEEILIVDGHQKNDGRVYFYDDKFAGKAINILGKDCIRKALTLNY